MEKSHLVDSSIVRGNVEIEPTFFPYMEEILLFLRICIEFFTSMVFMEIQETKIIKKIYILELSISI